MNKLGLKQKDILYVLISSFILVIIWIGFNIYHSYVTSTISDTENAQSLPINPRFDTTTIEKLKTRKKISPLYNIAVTPTSKPTPTINLRPQPTISVSISPTVSASITPTRIPNLP